jgi:hypothetical protein
MGRLTFEESNDIGSNASGKDQIQRTSHRRLNPDQQHRQQGRQP